MLPKSKRRAYVGFDDSSSAVKFYSAETCKVLISQNFRIINPPATIPVSEPIVIGTNPRHEGESGDGDMLWMGRTGLEVITLDFSLKRWCTTDFGNDPIPETESDGKTLNLGNNKRQRKRNDGIVDLDDIDINEPRTM